MVVSGLHKLDTMTVLTNISVRIYEPCTKYHTAKRNEQSLCQGGGVEHSSTGKVTLKLVSNCRVSGILSDRRKRNMVSPIAPGGQCQSHGGLWVNRVGWIEEQGLILTVVI